MARIINDRPGFVVDNIEEPVAPNQTIRPGDLLKYQAGNTGAVVVAAIGDTGLLGAAEHGITTGAVVTARDRVNITPFTAISRHRGTVKNATALDRTLIGQAAGFIDEGGEIRIDTAATVKQVLIVEIAERPFSTTDPKEVKFMVKDLNNRVR